MLRVFCLFFSIVAYHCMRSNSITYIILMFNPTGGDDPFWQAYFLTEWLNHQLGR